MNVAGEMEHSVVENDAKVGSTGSLKAAVLRHRFDRIPIKIGFKDPTMADERYAGSGDTVIIEGELIRPKEINSKTVVLFMHPSGIQVHNCLLSRRQYKVHIAVFRTCFPFRTAWRELAFMS